MLSASYYYGYGFDMTYLLVIIGAVLCLAAQGYVKSTYSRYAKVPSHAGMTGAEAAKRILERNGIYDVAVRHVSGQLTDHYDPRSKVVNLSDATYGSTSVAAIGVAAHECGHVLQHAEKDMFLAFRTAIVPVANIGSQAAWPLIIIGLFLNGSVSYYIIMAGVIAFSLSVLFQLVTLPVEFGASRRALAMIEDYGILGREETAQSRAVLRAAALTYVAGAAASILQLLRLLMIANRRRR